MYIDFHLMAKSVQASFYPIPFQHGIVRDDTTSTKQYTLHMGFFHNGESYRVQVFYTLYEETTYGTLELYNRLEEELKRKIRNVLTGISNGLKGFRNLPDLTNKKLLLCLNTLD